MPQTAAAVRRELRRHKNPEKAAFFPRFFKTGKGEYGEGDRFIGVVVPDQRRVSKQFRDLGLNEIAKLLADPIHEYRLTGVFILVHQFERGDETDKRRRVEFLLDNFDGINNWDIVDTAGPKILGPWLLDHPRKLQDELAASGEIWKERIAVVACMPLIKNDEFREIKKLSRKFLKHPHDLMHKACGWMLREMGKRDEDELRGFLDRNARKMPRTMLRYSIERLSKQDRAHYMGL